LLAANQFEDLKGISVELDILPKRCIPKCSERHSKGAHALRIFRQFARLLTEDKDCVPFHFSLWNSFSNFDSAAS
jgi:hypothetical protein